MKPMRLSKALITISILSTLTFICLCVVFGYLLFGGRGAGERIQIPDYVGQRLSDVTEDKRFDFDVNYVYSDSASEGLVVSQDPEPLSHRRVGRGEKYSVKISVSLGRKSGKIPDLLGRDSREAAAILRGMGFSVKLSYLPIEGCASGIVQKTLPEVGQSANEGDVVELFVSKRVSRTTVTVPDLVGIDIDDALVKIYSNGLSEGEIEGSGRVLSQYPVGGAVVLEGEKIDLYCEEPDGDYGVDTADENKENKNPWWEYFRFGHR